MLPHSERSNASLTRAVPRAAPEQPSLWGRHVPAATNPGANFAVCPFRRRLFSSPTAKAGKFFRHGPLRPGRAIQRYASIAVEPGSVNRTALPPLDNSAWVRMQQRRRSARPTSGPSSPRPQRSPAMSGLGSPQSGTTRSVRRTTCWAYRLVANPHSPAVRLVAVGRFRFGSFLLQCNIAKHRPAVFVNRRRCGSPEMA